MVIKVVIKELCSNKSCDKKAKCSDKRERKAEKIGVSTSSLIHLYFVLFNNSRRRVGILLNL